MKLQRLRLGALGPFSGVHDIDLGRVCTGGLFLLEGPTGAGKSTILDAITFALYGGVAGRSTSKDRLVSDFAADGEPFAEIDFAIGGSNYRIRRTPAFERAKRDGSGTTTVTARVWLWRRVLDDSNELFEELISNRVREADDEVRRLLGGLSLEQFCQVVVLPQGEFATFLRADAEHRRDVLQRLFATDHYQVMERIAGEQRIVAQRELALSDQSLRDGIVSLRQALGDVSADDLTIDVDELVAMTEAARSVWLESVRSHVASLNDAAMLTDADAQRMLAALTTAHQGVVAVHEAIRRRLQLTGERAQLNVMAQHIGGLAKERDRAMRVQALKPMFDERERIELQCSAQTAICIGHERALTETLDVSLPTPPSAEHILDLSQRLAEELLELGPARSIEEGLAVQSASLKSLLDQQRVVIDQVTTFSQRVEQLPEQLAALVQQRDVLRDLAVRAPDLQLRLGAAQERLRAWEQREALDARVLDCETEVRAVVDQSQNARDDVQVATERRLAGMAAELAGSLAAGDACAVCGSTEHPNLAQAVDEPVSQEQLDELTRVFDDLAERRRDLESVLSSAVAERERNRALAGDVDPATEIAELEELVRQASQAELDLPTCAAQADLLQRELDESRAGLAKAQSQLVSLDEQIAGQAAQVAESTSFIESKRGDYTSIAERVEVLTSHVGITSEWARATSEAENLQRHLLAISEAIDAAAREAGCEDTADALAGVRSDERLRAVTSEIADYERAVAINAAALAESDEVEIPEITPDLDVANEQLNLANRAAELARTKATSAQITVNEVGRCVAAITAASAAIAEVTARTAPTIRVADALTGQGRVNPRRMTLSTYVLRERFASVVEAASRRLDRMSDGRYVLERDEAVSGNRKAGLGLLVLDQWTGARRDTRTLSGGESFYASLALALGLADVVRDETGGVELETLFIDEGFGSLDPESLESVLSVIDSLRDGGRVVGIVSHVSELKERIPDRIEIRRRPDGSSTVAVRAT